MAYVAKRDTLMLMILNDDDPAIHPREDCDNFGKMTCWHRDYNLGDTHDFSDPNEFLKDLVLETVSDDDIINHVRSGNVKDLRLEYDRSAKGWDIRAYYEPSNEWCYQEFYEGSMNEVKDEIAEGLVNEMNDNDLMTLARTKNLILPLNLYDHSILRMSTQSFIGRAVHAEWDSGQVGYTHASHEDIQKEYGKVAPENIAKAEELLESAVSAYDAYLCGEVYGFKLFENGEEKDSCWGFVGFLEDIKDNIAYYLPDENKDLVEDLEYIEENETLMYETEYEQEYAV